MRIEGEIDKPGTCDLEDLLKGRVLQERIYRLRCVVGWPMVSLLKRFEPNTRAKYVEFVTLLDARQMQDQRSRVLEWPYVEGLRIDEPMHPLAIFAVRLYGSPLPNQNGAPLRAVVPWKYGFKSASSIVAIRFTERRPMTAWQRGCARRIRLRLERQPRSRPPPPEAEDRTADRGVPQAEDPSLQRLRRPVGHLTSGMDLRTHLQ